MKAVNMEKDYYRLSDNIIEFMDVLPTINDFLILIKQKRNTLDVRSARGVLEAHLGMLESKVKDLNEDLMTSKFVRLRDHINVEIKEFFILETLVATNNKDISLISTKINTIKDLNTKLKLELRNFNNVTFQKINELREAA
jgi:hypothetical protein